jgi:hypothetical protein
MQRDLTGALLLGGGAGLILVSFALPLLLVGRWQWTDAMARQLQQASMNYHDAIHVRAHGGAKSDDDGRFDLARREFEQLQARKSGIHARARWSVAIARTAGFVALLAGAARAWWQHQASSSGA